MPLFFIRVRSTEAPSEMICPTCLQSLRSRSRSKSITRKKTPGKKVARAKPVELHGMHYWHILQDGKPPASSLFTIAISFTASGDWYFLSWFLLTHVAKHGERERAKQLFDVVKPIGKTS
ncbi:hypothetical protein T03_2719 [Trichinella britovi]|uniref:Uncharacterized protein n=1 Tax=Trichinella britovi TaxID=45882 RepID=A0A0V1CDV1_TRIBR|nr:hypothetical protein T03_2719 [Trichinella britovi]